MPRKGKRKALSPHFHPSFKQPSKEERDSAIGDFPGATHAAQSRTEMLSSYDLDSSIAPQAHTIARPSLESAQATVMEALRDLDDPALYVPTPRSQTSFAVPKPRDELDWLSQVPEEGQSFDDYISFLTSRSGRIKPIANQTGQQIALLPIVRSDKGTASWPAHGPKLDLLVAHTKAFYDREVQVLQPAIISTTIQPAIISTTIQDANSEVPGSFASATKGDFSIRFPREEESGSGTSKANVVGRSDPVSHRIQLQVNSLLFQLALFHEGSSGFETRNNFCIMGITMEDLYDGPRDLFCAGMAAGGSKVAVFSFFRYHPHIKMHPLYWYNYGYEITSNSHPYYDDNNQNPTGLLPSPPNIDALTAEANADFLRRSSKLLIHELGHLYGLSHCIFHRCLMMGTGHLVEDFAAPSHLCGICLRKLQWRLGFKVNHRYGLLQDSFNAMGLKKEAEWTSKQFQHIAALAQKGQVRVLECATTAAA